MKSRNHWGFCYGTDNVDRSTDRGTCGIVLFDTVRLRRMQVQRDAAKEEVAEVKQSFCRASVTRSRHR